jgi:hypothetical protein
MVIETTRSENLYCITTKYLGIRDAILSYTLVLKFWKKWVLCCQWIWHFMEIIVTMMVPRFLFFGKLGRIYHDN